MMDGVEVEVVDADVDALKVMLTLVEPEGAWSLPPLALAPFLFHVRVEIGGGCRCL
jgi:hypothetical protein